MQCNRRKFVVATAGMMAVAYGGRLSTASAQEATAAPEGGAANGLIVFADTIQGGQNVPEDQQAMRSCVLSSRFPRNSQIVWRARVIDPKTGAPMDDLMLDKVEVTLSDGQTLEMEYGAHPPAPNPPRDYYWTIDWLIPKDYPTGTFGYTIMATGKEGQTGEFKPFDVAPSLPTVTDEVLQDIAEED